MNRKKFLIIISLLVICLGAIGVIAEDLYETFPELVQKDSDGLVSSVSYVDMIVPLVSEVQRLNNVITKQQNEIDELKSLIS